MSFDIDVNLTKRELKVVHRGRAFDRDGHWNLTKRELKGGSWRKGTGRITLVESHEERIESELMSLVLSWLTLENLTKRELKDHTCVRR